MSKSQEYLPKIRPINSQPDLRNSTGTTILEEQMSYFLVVHWWSFEP